MVLPTIRSGDNSELLLICPTRFCPFRLAAVKAVICIVGIIAGGRLVVRPLYRRISALKNSDVFAATTLLVVLGTSVLTQAAGLSLALGAFLVSLLCVNRADAAIVNSKSSTTPLLGTALTQAAWSNSGRFHAAGAPASA